MILTHYVTGYTVQEVIDSLPRPGTRWKNGSFFIQSYTIYHISNSRSLWERLLNKPPYWEIKVELKREES